MKIKKFAALLAGVLSASVLFASAAMADATKVVTLGADLTAEQRDAVLRYFGVYGQNVETLYITNTDERNHLGSYIPLEQIGTRTYSCALVKPTSSGGIQVKTANLSYVTSNMIASTLSTSGVVNCEVLAAAPFPVSGTGALTGIIMAYESASGQQLSEEKKEIATQELVTTQNIANTIGQNQATEIVNEIKIQVIQNQVVDQGQVEEIVSNVLSETTTDEAEPVEGSLSDEDRALLEDLAMQIAQQQYNYEEMKETLERVENNVTEINDTVSDIQEGMQQADDSSADSGDANVQIEPENAASENTETLAEDSILMNTDDTALGEGVLIDATAPEAVEQTEAAPADAAEDQGIFDIVTEDSASVGSEDGFAEQDNLEEEGSSEEGDSLEEQGSPEEGSLEEQGSFEDENNPEAQENQEVSAEPVVLDGGIYPSSQTSPQEALGQNFIVLYLNQPELTPTGGTVAVESQGINVLTVDLTDTEKVRTRAMSDETLMERGWSAGTEVLVFAGSTFASADRYAITVNGEFTNATEQDAAVYTFDQSTETDTSVDTGVTFSGENIGAFTAGSTVTATILADPAAAAYATVSSYDENLLMLSATEVFLDSGETGFDVTLLASGNADITVDIYDYDGNLIASVVKTIPVV